jgi:hypothetical protein
MSVKVNNEVFDIYSQDTQDTILERYLISLSNEDKGENIRYIIPKYAKITIVKDTILKPITKQVTIGGISITEITEPEHKINALERVDFECKTLADLIQKQEELNFLEEEKFNKGIKKWLIEALQEGYPIKDEKEMIFLYTILSVSTPNDASYNDSFSYIRENTLNYWSLSNFLGQNEVAYETFFNEYYREWNSLITRQQRYQELSEKLNRLNQYDMGKIFISPLQQTQIRYDGEFQLTVDIYELLNQIVPSRLLPFVKIAKFYKLLNYFILPPSWLEVNDEGNDTLRLYILKDVVEPEINIREPRSEHYIMIKIDQTSDTGSIFKYKYSISSEEGDVSIELDLIFKRFFNHLGEKPLKMTYTKTFGKGFIIMKGLPLTREVIYDYALNDDIVSQIMTIREIFKIEKIKGGIRFNLFQTVSCTAYLKILDQPSNQEIELFPNALGVGDYIIRIQVNSTKGKDRSESKIKSSLDQLARGFVYMNETKEQYFVNYYKSKLKGYTNIDDLIDIKQVQEEKTETLQKILPEFFKPGYGRQCQSKQQPVIVSELEMNQLKDKYDVMKYPLEGEKQTWFVCNTNDTFKYVGYGKNTLSNRATHGFLPCCYKTEQKDDKSGYRYQYEHNLIDIRGNSLTGQDIEFEQKNDVIIKTNKILKSDRYGFLPPHIQSLIVSITFNDLQKTRYLRKGKDLNPRSAFYCLMDATDRKEPVNKELKKLMNYNLTSQTMIFPKDLEHIIDHKEDVSPIQLLTILEDLFGVNIIVFYRNKTDNTDGSFDKPNYKKYLLVNKNRKAYPKTVLLFRTFGSEIDKVEYPQTELIVMENIESSKAVDKVNTRNIVKLFDTNSDFIQKLFELYQSTINIVYETVEFKSPIVNQIEDSYGKIRTLLFELESNVYITVYITPISPLNVQQFIKGDTTYNGKHQVTRYSNALIKRFFNKEVNISSIKKMVYTNPNRETLLVGYCFTIDQKQGFVYVDDYSDTNDITTSVYDLEKNEYLVPLSLMEQSFLQQYNSYLRIANMLMAYACYLFSSKHPLDKLIDTKTNDEFNTTLQEYVNEFSNSILVKDGHIYVNKNRSLKLDNTSFVKDKQLLIVPSEEMKKRLLYHLYISVKQDIQYMIQYKSKKYIPNYYTTPNDFVSNEHYTIYYTQKEVVLYVTNPGMIYQSYSYPPNPNAELFFLSNEEIERGIIFLVQKCPTIGNAIYTSTFFGKNRVNTSDRESEVDEHSVNLNIFVIEEKITFHQIYTSRLLETVYVLFMKINGELLIYSLIKY